jgi:hypothetical protein
MVGSFYVSYPGRRSSRACSEGLLSHRPYRTSIGGLDRKSLTQVARLATGEAARACNKRSRRSRTRLQKEQAEPTPAPPKPPKGAALVQPRLSACKAYGSRRVAVLESSLATAAPERAVTGRPDNPYRVMSVHAYRYQLNSTRESGVRHAWRSNAAAQRTGEFGPAHEIEVGSPSSLQLAGLALSLWTLMNALQSQYTFPQSAGTRSPQHATLATR